MKRQSPDIDQLHHEQLVYIGKLLQATRETHALSYETVAEKTLIRPSLLRAIEAADVSQLPEPVYMRGLIRRYGDSLGLDGEALASQYFTPPSAKKTRSFWRVPEVPQLRPVHLYLIYVLLIAIAISALSYTLKRTTYSTSTLPILEGETAEDAMMPEGGVASEANATQDNAAPASTGEASAPVRVAVEMQDQSWLRITTDGEVAFEGILKEGDARAWTAEKELKIRAGNAGGVAVSFNEGSAQVLGKPGVVTEVTFPPEDTTARLNL